MNLKERKEKKNAKRRTQRLDRKIESVDKKQDNIQIFDGLPSDPNFHINNTALARETDTGNWYQRNINNTAWERAISDSLLLCDDDSDIKPFGGGRFDTPHNQIQTSPGVSSKAAPCDHNHGIGKVRDIAAHIVGRPIGSLGEIDSDGTYGPFDLVAISNFESDIIPQPTSVHWVSLSHVTLAQL